MQNKTESKTKKWKNKWASLRHTVDNDRHTLDKFGFGIVGYFLFHVQVCVQCKKNKIHVFQN